MLNYSEFWIVLFLSFNYFAIKSFLCLKGMHIVFRRKVGIWLFCWWSVQPKKIHNKFSTKWKSWVTFFYFILGLIDTMRFRHVSVFSVGIFIIRCFIYICSMRDICAVVFLSKYYTFDIAFQPTISKKLFFTVSINLD